MFLPLWDLLISDDINPSPWLSCSFTLAGPYDNDLQLRVRKRSAPPRSPAAKKQPRRGPRAPRCGREASRSRPTSRHSTGPGSHLERVSSCGAPGRARSCPENLGTGCQIQDLHRHVLRPSSTRRRLSGPNDLVVSGACPSRKFSSIRSSDRALGSCSENGSVGRWGSPRREFRGADSL